MIEALDIPLDQIEVGTRLRQVSQEQVDRLKESILEVSLVNPITVYRRSIIRSGISVDGFGLVAGAHRLETFRQIGLCEIPAVVVDLTDLERQLVEVDENLCGTVLTPSERARFTARRKDIYIALHPETRHGALGNGREQSRQVGDSTSDSNFKPIERFTADTAAKTGQSERAVQRDAERGEKVIPEVMVMVKGTKLDTGTYLDKIKDLRPNEQVAAVKRDLREPRPKKAKPKGGIAGRYTATAPTAKAEGMLLLDFLSIADELTAMVPTMLVADAGKKRSVLGQRASGLIDHLTEIMRVIG